MTIYLDNTTAAPLSAATLEKMLPFFRERWGHPTAPHAHGQAVLPAIHEAEMALRQLVGASKEAGFIFTSSHAEAINHVVSSVYLDVTRQTGKNHFVTAVVDEAPAILAASRLNDLGCVMQMAPCNAHGQVTAAAVADTITPRTALVTLSWSSALTGVIHPIAEIAKLCKERGILLHVDATHVLGKGYFTWSDCGADFLTFNGEPLHGPKGTGMLFIKEKQTLSPFILGGKEQGGLRGGSFNVPAFVGLGFAARLAYEGRDFLCTEIARLRDRFEKEIASMPGCRVLFQEEERLAHVSCIEFANVTAEALLFCLQRKNLFAGFGGGNFQKMSLILKASGIETHSALSFALSRDTTDEEIARATALIDSCYKHLLRCWEGR